MSSGYLDGIIYNLLPGQYQIGKLVFGRHTTVRVETCDVKPYDVNPQDYQVSRADEIRFGWDSLKPSTIELTFDVLESQLLDIYADSIPNFWAEMPTVADFQKVWKADDTRNLWGEMLPLYICGTDGITRTVYGRPRQFTYGMNSPYTRAIQCLGEFQRADTLSYSVNETGYGITQAEPSATIPGTDGDGPSWFRIVMEGPVTNPSFTFTGLSLNGITQTAPLTMSLSYTVAADEIIEINSYPWSRRAVSSNGLNLSPNLGGDTPYLDRLRFNNDATLIVTMGGTGMTSDTDAAILYRDAYQIVG